MGPIEVPSELELLTFFSSEALKKEETIYYQTKDQDEVELLFYFNYASATIGIKLTKNDYTILNMSHEELIKIEIVKTNKSEELLATCNYSEAQVFLRVLLTPKISILCESISR